MHKTKINKRTTMNSFLNESSREVQKFTNLSSENESECETKKDFKQGRRDKYQQIKIAKSESCNSLIPSSSFRGDSSPQKSDLSNPNNVRFMVAKNRISLNGSNFKTKKKSNLGSYYQQKHLKRFKEDKNCSFNEFDSKMNSQMHEVFKKRNRSMPKQPQYSDQGFEFQENAKGEAYEWSKTPNFKVSVFIFWNYTFYTPFIKNIVPCHNSC